MTNAWMHLEIRLVFVFRIIFKIPFAMACMTLVILDSHPSVRFSVVLFDNTPPPGPFGVPFFIFSG